MARLNLSSRVEKWWPKLAKRDLEELPGGLSKQLDLLLRQMGITREQFVKYRPSTRAKYISAAKKGRTVPEERTRVKEQRTARKAAKTTSDKATREAAADRREVKLSRIMEIRRLLVAEYGMDTHRGDNTQVDQIEAEVLLARQSIYEHIKVYGVDYVLDRMEHMLLAVESDGIGARQWTDFAASSETDIDERWFWYHTQPTALVFQR